MSKKSSMVCSPLWFSVYQGEWGRLPLCSLRDRLPNWQTREISLIHSAFKWGASWTSPWSGPPSCAWEGIVSPLLLTPCSSPSPMQESDFLLHVLVCSTWPPYIIIIIMHNYTYGLHHLSNGYTVNNVYMSSCIIWRWTSLGVPWVDIICMLQWMQKGWYMRATSPIQTKWGIRSQACWYQVCTH